MSPIPKADPDLSGNSHVSMNGKAVIRVPCQSKLLKISLPELAGNLLSRRPRKTVHWKVPCWSHSTMKLPKVGTEINCRLEGAADHHALQGPDAGEVAHTTGACWASTPEPGRRTPFLLLCVSNALNCAGWQKKII